MLGLDLKQANNARLQQVYVPAVVPARHSDESEARGRGARRTDSAPPKVATPCSCTRLGEESLYVPGDPGAGKSTFCRWAALVTALGRVPDHPVPCADAYREELPEGLLGRLPVLFHLRDLAAEKDLVTGRRPLDPEPARETPSPAGSTGRAPGG